METKKNLLIAIIEDKYSHWNGSSMTELDVKRSRGPELIY